MVKFEFKQQILEATNDEIFDLVLNVNLYRIFLRGNYVMWHKQFTIIISISNKLLVNLYTNERGNYKR
jgi:hypothetical protein